MIAASVGVGTGTDAYRAGAEACYQAIGGLPSGVSANAIIVFASTSFDQDKLIEGVSDTAPAAVIVGCSTAGEISSEGFSTEKSVVVMALSSDQMRFWSGIGNHILWNAHQAGEDFANNLQYDSRGYITSCLAFFDILSGNGDAALLGIQGKLGEKFPLFGGAASDDLLFFETYQYLQNKAYRGSIVGIGLSGDYHMASVIMQRFLPIGLSRKVTRAEGTTLMELDGKPAASIYEEYFGEEHLADLRDGLLPSLAISYPLGVFMPDSDRAVLRNPVFVDQKGAMTFASEIPVGAEIRLMITDVERALETSALTANEVLRKLEGRKPKAVIIINSIARKKILGPRADEEIEIIQQILGRDVPIIGFYSYAQIGEQYENQIPFHNGALLIWALAE